MQAYQPYAQRYKEVAVKTSNPLQLVVMLYDGAIQAIREAQNHLKNNAIADRVRCINRSVAIISELQACLNFKEGGDLARSLDRLYVYMQRRLFQANVDQSQDPLTEVIKLMDNLRSAWSQISSETQMREAAPLIPAFRSGSSPITELGTLNISG